MTTTLNPERTAVSPVLFQSGLVNDLGNLIMECFAWRTGAEKNRGRFNLDYLLSVCGTISFGALEQVLACFGEKVAIPLALI